MLLPLTPVIFDERFEEALLSRAYFLQPTIVLIYIQSPVNVFIARK